MTKYIAANVLLACLVTVAAVKPSVAQMAPKSDRAGNPVSMIRNDATTPVTIEYRSNSEWQQLKVDAGKDTSITGDRIRVATTREDKAIVTVDLPISPGKKYRLLWNAQAGMWDFSSAP